MASATKLRARIDELSEELERQKQIVKDLERQRSTVQSQLNALVDPMARLPLEISSDIFRQCLSSRHDVRTCSTLLRVCHAWNAIALATSSLWNVIVSSDVPDAKVADFLQIWLPRSRSLRFTLTLRRIDRDHLSGVMDVLQKHGHRVGSLIFVDTDPTSLTIPLHALTALRIEASEHYPSSFPLSSILNLLRGAPNLQICEFGSVQCHALNVEGTLTCSSLRVLALVNEPSRSRMSSAEILLHLTLPALEKLYLQLNIDETAFLHFLIRSSPPLRFLQLDSRATALSPALVKCLQTMHSLTELETHCRTECNWDILDTLTATPALLSNLQNIAVHGRTQSPEGYQRVVDFLASRRATIRRLHLAGDDARAFFEDVGPAVREFGEEGIDIIVGP